MKLKKFEQQKVDISKRFFSDTNLIQSVRIRHLLATTEQKIRDETTSCHGKKISKLCNIQPFGSSSSVANLSSYNLSPVEHRALSRGLEFGLTPASRDDYEFKTVFELFCRDLHIDSSDSSTATQVRSCLFNLNKLFRKNNLKKLEKNLPKSEMSSLLNLAENNDLIIIKLDKGNGVVILDKKDYITKSLDILSDYTKFRILNNDTLDTNEYTLNRILRKLLKQGHMIMIYIMNCLLLAQDLVFITVYKKFTKLMLLSVQ